MKRIIAFFLLALSFSASADQIVSGFVSRHTAPGFNESNHGIGYRTDDGVTVGVYRNSLYRTSVYVSKEFDVASRGPFTVGYGVGLATGYKYAVIPLAYPTVRVKFDRVTLAFGAGPPIKDVVAGVIFAQLRFDI
jgi:hypothetical protein